MIDVAVVGSLHLDIMVEAPRLPGRDETLMGESWHYKCGGKGGNQAVAAARFGARTSFGGRVGSDDFGERLVAHLRSAGVDTRHVGVDSLTGSGMSVAIQEADGEYGAVAVPGANKNIAASSIAGDWAALWVCSVLLLQNEIPEAVNIAAANLAKAHKAKVLLNAAPARSMPDQLLEFVDVLIINRVEAAMLAGFQITTPADAERAATAFTTEKRDVIVTLGKDGLVLRTRAGYLCRVPARSVEVISSHGAGDCFCGALAAQLARHGNLEAACRYGSKAAAMFVSTPAAGKSDVNDAALGRWL